MHLIHSSRMDSSMEGAIEQHEMTTKGRRGEDSVLETRSPLPIEALSLLVNACASSPPIVHDRTGGNAAMEYQRKLSSSNSLKGVIYAHPLLGHRQAYDVKVWEEFDPTTSSNAAVWPLMWGGRHHHFKLSITSLVPGSIIDLELWWRPNKNGPLEVFPDQDILRIGAQKSDGDIRDTVWHDDLQHLGTKAPKIWVQTNEKQIKLDETGNLRVRLRINRKSEYDVEYRYRKEYVIRIASRSPANPGHEDVVFSSPILVPAKGMKKGNSTTETFNNTSINAAPISFPIATPFIGSKRTSIMEDDDGDDGEEIGFEGESIAPPSTKSLKRKFSPDAIAAPSNTLLMAVTPSNADNSVYYNTADVTGGGSNHALKRIKLVASPPSEDEEEEDEDMPVLSSYANVVSSGSSIVPMTEVRVNPDDESMFNIIETDASRTITPDSILLHGMSSALNPVNRLPTNRRLSSELEGFQNMVKNRANELVAQQIDLTRRYELEQRQLLHQWKKLLEMMNDHSVKSHNSDLDEA